MEKEIQAHTTADGKVIKIHKQGKSLANLQQLKKIDVSIVYFVENVHSRPFLCSLQLTAKISQVASISRNKTSTKHTKNKIHCIAWLLTFVYSLNYSVLNGKWDQSHFSLWRWWHIFPTVHLNQSSGFSIQLHTCTVQWLSDVFRAFIFVYRLIFSNMATTFD